MSYFWQEKVFSSKVIEAFKAIGGCEMIIEDPDLIAAYCQEWRGVYHAQAALVLRPQTVQQVCQILKIAHTHRICVIPQTGNTGLVGGQVPSQNGAEVVLSLSRLKALRALSRLDGSATVEAGVTLKTLQEWVATEGCFFPLSLPSEGSCGIGGNLATNAGGLSVLAYGMMRELCLGLEVVLADGTLLEHLSPVRKRNMGYDLKQLFIGSEGTLGVITAATLKILPQQKSQVSAFIEVSSPKEALDFLLFCLDQAGSFVTAFELIPHLGLALQQTHMGASFPFPLKSPWFILLELSTPSPWIDLKALSENFLGLALEKNLVSQITLAAHETQRRSFWQWRHHLSEVQKRAGASIKHDVALPRSQLGLFLEKAEEAVLAILPEARLLPFGHLGDGNIHYDICQPLGMDASLFLSYQNVIHDTIHALAHTLGGAVSAEHGIGQTKRDLLKSILLPQEYDLFWGIKNLFDPRGILNPNKLLK